MILSFTILLNIQHKYFPKGKIFDNMSRNLSFNLFYIEILELKTCGMMQTFKFKRAHDLLNFPYQ